MALDELFTYFSATVCTFFVNTLVCKQIAKLRYKLA